MPVGQGISKRSEQGISNRQKTAGHHFRIDHALVFRKISKKAALVASSGQTQGNFLSILLFIIWRVFKRFDFENNVKMQYLNLKILSTTQRPWYYYYKNIFF